MLSLRLLKINALEKLLTLRSNNASQPVHLATGERGELSALFYLQRQAFVVVARRWKTPRQRGDIDLIAWEGDTLCFIEVKTRSGRDVATGESSVDEDKRRILRRIARQYLKGIQPPPQTLRFDVVAIYFTGEKIEWKLYRQAFGW